MTIAIARISDAPLDAAAHLAAVEQPWVGAVTSFIGTVRAQDPEAAGPVVALEYSAHPDAEATLHDIAMSAIGDRRAIVAVSHRVGRLAVGDAAVEVRDVDGSGEGALAGRRHGFEHKVALLHHVVTGRFVGVVSAAGGHQRGAHERAHGDRRAATRAAAARRRRRDCAAAARQDVAAARRAAARRA